MQGRPEIADKYISKLDAVKARDVSAFLNKYYTPQGLSEATLIPN